MQKNFIIVYPHSGMAKMFEEERQSKAAKSAFLQQYIRDVADVDVLLDTAYRVAFASDEADYFDQVPAIMGQLYSYSLHFNAVRRQLVGSTGFFVDLQSLLPDICHLCETIERFLVVLEDLYEEHIGFDDENEDGDEGDEEEDSGETDEDTLCEVSIQCADGVSKQTMRLIAAGIQGVLAAHLGDIEVEHRREDNGCGDCSCDGRCCKEDLFFIRAFSPAGNSRRRIL